MKSSFARKALKSLHLLFLAGMSAFALNGCGGGGGATGEPQVAPSTLEGVKVSFFNAFDITFYQLSGAPDNEAGAGDFDGNAATFNIGFTDNGNTVADPIDVPSVLSDLKYTYVRTSADTGRITLNWTTEQKSAYEAALDSKSDYMGNQIIWNFFPLVVDVLFVDGGGAITTTASRVRGYQAITLQYDRPMGMAPVERVNSAVTVEFESPNVVFTELATGRPLPTNYQVNRADTEPSGIVWTSFAGRSVEFMGTGVPSTLFVAYRSANGGLLEVPGVMGIDDSGTMLVDALSQGVSGGAGDFGYRRTGGANASFSIRYDLPGGGVYQLDYKLVFDSLQGGTWTDSLGNTGTFLENLDMDNP